MTTRADVLLQSVPRTASIIEVGASYNPVAPKKQGWKSKTIDVGTRSEIIKKYGDLGLEGALLENIEEVDFVWRDGALIDAVPSQLHGTFDAFIASHVIEHQPDLVAFLDCAERLLTSTGVVVLVIPDKRYCFDYFRPLAMTGDVLDAHRIRRTRHSKKTIFNSSAYTVSADGRIAWGQEPIQDLSFSESLEAAYSEFLTRGEDEASPYVDMHAWQFTPASFELLILELARLGVVDWQVDSISPTVGCEFNVWLRRGGREAANALADSDLIARRMALLARTLFEAKEQFEFSAPARANSPAGISAADERMKIENEMLRAECSALQSRLTEVAAACATAENARDALMLELNEAVLARDTLKATSEKWFEAVIAVTADHNPMRGALPRRSAWLRKIIPHFDGDRRRPSPTALANRARDAGKWELAIRYYREALDLKPDDPAVWVECGHALREAGKMSEAEAAYRKAIELDGQSTATNGALNHLLLMKHRSTQSMTPSHDKPLVEAQGTHATGI